MTPASPNTASLDLSARAPASPRRGRRRWWLVIASLFALVGGLIIAYPFLPALRYYVLRPKPVLPYATKLTSKQLTSLPALPVVGTKPIPKENRLVIPSIGVDMPILEGPTERTLDRGGIWHIPGTSNPSQGSNMVLSGHRWQYLPPSSMTLYLLDKVKLDEPIIVYWRGQEYDYRIVDRRVVDPSATDIQNPTEQPRLTIYTCTPLFSTKQRLVLFGELIS